MEYLSLWKNERISDDAFDFTEKEEEEKLRQEIKLAEERKRQQELKTQKELLQKAAAKQREEREKTEKENQEKDFLSLTEGEDGSASGEGKDDKNMEGNKTEERTRIEAQRKQRKERRRIMLIKSSSTLLYQMMSEGAMSMQDFLNAQKVKPPDQINNEAGQQEEEREDEKDKEGKSAEQTQESRITEVTPFKSVLA